MNHHSSLSQQKVGEIEQSTRSLINSALFYLSDPSLPDSVSNARRCLETAKYVLEGIYIPTELDQHAQPLAYAGRKQWPTGVVESWGFVNNTETDPLPVDYTH